MRLSAWLLFFPVLLTAQGTIGVGGGSSGRLGSPRPAAVPAQPSRPEDLCAIDGQVVNAVSGEPIRRASIIIMRADLTSNEGGPPTSYTTQSNATGQFAMKDIEPGRYRLSVTRNGYVPFTYGAKAQSRQGTMLSLTRQQRMTDLALKLTPQAVVIGRILDADGEPAANARIALQGYRYVNGKKQLSPSGGMNSTNDLGEYRIFGVAPGKYYLSVTPMPNGPNFAVDRSAISAPEEDYVATYYPGVIDPASATQLDIPAGAQLRGIDLVLSKARTVHVKGRVTHASSGRQHISVFLTPRSGGVFGAIRNNQVDAAGNFDIGNVTAGAYTLTAVINGGDMPMQGRMPVDVGGSNVEGLNVNVGPGVNLKGRVRAEVENASLDLSNVTLHLQPREQGGLMFGGPTQGKSDESGAFEIKNVSPDHYDLMVIGLPSGAYIKTIRSDQVDVLSSGLDTTNGPPAAVEVVISPKAATLSGTVQNSQTGNPAAGATVVLIPQEQERRGRQSWYKMITADQNGGFSLAGVPPGEYKAYAWEDLEFGAYMDPDFMKPFEDKGEAVTLRESDRNSVQLKLLPAEVAASAK